MANTIVKTPTVYQGGKTSIINHILELVPVHEVYTETYFGGGTLFWSKEPVKNETINDRLDIVINFYRVLKFKYRALKKLIDASLISRTIHKEAQDIIRNKKYGYQVNDVQLAWAFWLCSNFSHMNKLMGGYKQEKGGGRSVPQQLQKRKVEFTDRMVHRIENTCIENTDALIVLNARNSKEAFHYLDPIYPDTSAGSYGYFGHKNTWNDYENLLKWCATECKGKFLLSSYNNEVLNGYTQIYGWNKKEITHELKTARKNGTQTHRTEILIRNYKNTCATLSLFQ